MYEIYLICSLHKEKGNCNSNELYKIIDKIRPDIIFLELTKTDYDKYQTGKINTVETNAVSIYNKKYKTKNIPVDKIEMTIEYHLTVENMNNKLCANSNELKNAYLIFETLLSQNGFSFLNSELCEDYTETLNVFESKAVRKINNNELTKLFRMSRDVHNERENEMIKCIYEYSKTNQYKKGIFFIGAWHRKTIRKKILEYNNNEDIKINWIFWTN